MKIPQKQRDAARGAVSMAYVMYREKVQLSFQDVCKNHWTSCQMPSFVKRIKTVSLTHVSKAAQVDIWERKWAMWEQQNDSVTQLSKLARNLPQGCQQGFLVPHWAKHAVPSHGEWFSHHQGPEELRGLCASVDALWVKSTGVVIGNFKELVVFPGEKAYKVAESPLFQL